MHRETVKRSEHIYQVSLQTHS